jgi:hypothetical protein
MPISVFNLPFKLLLVLLLVIKLFAIYSSIFLLPVKSLKVKLLVGLQVCNHLNKVLEYGNQDEPLSQDEHFNEFITSIGFALNNPEMDTEAFYNQVGFFIQMLENGRLIIRKTENPNHAKLYLFRLNEHQAEVQNMEGQFVTGSSNLTKAGLSGQEEFNVEIKDYGFKEAESYFDELWEKAIPISEIEGRQQFLIQFIQHKSQVASVTPFEAYALILKTFLDLQLQKQIKPEVEGLLEEIGFKKFAYQTDAVNQALTVINEYNGVIIADVVGLGKSVIASLIAKNIGKRGMVICPPGLIGDKNYSTGWWEYVNNFKLYDWDVQSRGRLTEIAETIDNKGIEVLIIDEAHYFRHLFQAVKYINEQTILSYEEKYNYIKTLRAQLSTIEQYLIFFNSLSFMGRAWEFEHIGINPSKKQINNWLITKYNFIKNVPDLNLINDISIIKYYPEVHFEFVNEPLGREAVVQVFN